MRWNLSLLAVYLGSIPSSNLAVKCEFIYWLNPCDLFYFDNGFFYLKMGHSQILFAYFAFSTVNSKYVDYKFFADDWTQTADLGIGSDCFANWATITAHVKGCFDSSIGLDFIFNISDRWRFRRNEKLPKNYREIWNSKNDVRKASSRKRNRRIGGRGPRCRAPRPSYRRTFACGTTSCQTG